MDKQRETTTETRHRYLIDAQPECNPNAAQKRAPQRVAMSEIHCNLVAARRPVTSTAAAAKWCSSETGIARTGASQSRLEAPPRGVLATGCRRRRLPAHKCMTVRSVSTRPLSAAACAWRAGPTAGAAAAAAAWKAAARATLSSGGQARSMA